MDQYVDVMPPSAAPVKSDHIQADRITPAGRDEIDALTGIRGVAAVTVIAYHTYPASDFPFGLSHMVARG
jgi:hypothetical protein